MRQVWYDLLFMHWEADAGELQSRLPAGVKLDLFDGKAWLAVIPFDMRGVTLRGMPAPSFLSDFPEANVRTYVTVDGKPGVWFFSLDVTRIHAVWGARTFFHLPYYLAAMKITRSSEGVHYRSARPDRELEVSYCPGEALSPEPGSFLHWSTSRYCLYCHGRKGVYRGNIHHAPWPLKKVEVDLYRNTMLAPFNTGDPHPDMVYAPELPVVVYPLEKV